MNNIGNSFITNLTAIREKARQHVEDGAVTGNYRANRDAVLKLLNDALATEIVCVLRYKRHHFMAKGLYAEPVAEEFAEHAREEQEHADRLASRIVQLGGSPNLNPDELSSHSASEYVEGETLSAMIREDLIAERIAIDTYKEAIRFVGEDDPTTRRLLEEILSKEEEHADELSNLLAANKNGCHSSVTT